jgi:pimeloyl-ACP methyl ester carboxylesterase
MESGFADPGIAWGRSLIESIARISRVCVYDRAGLGYSDSRPDQPTDGGKISADLHLLLTGAGVEPPYVLVGHSIGGMYVRVYDHDHPGEVAGIVLIDSSHPDQFINAQKRLRPDDWARIQHSLETAWMDPTKEPSDWLRTSLLVRQTENIGDRPLWVLSHDPAANAGCQGSDCMSPEGQATWEAMWQELQTDLAGLSSRSSHSVVAGSGHYIHIGKPEPVIEAVAQVVEATR